MDKITNSKTDGRIIRLYGRDEFGNPLSDAVTGYCPPFYVPQSEFEKHRRLYTKTKWMKIGRVIQTRLGNIIEIRYPMEYHKMLKELHGKTLLADVAPNIWYMIDRKIKMDPKPRVLFFDFETDDREPGVVPGRDRILSCSATDMQTGEQFYHCHDDEKAVLTWVVSLIAKYDIISGWNSSSFDLKVLEKRWEKIFEKPMDKSVMRWTHIDYMNIFIEQFKKRAAEKGVKEFPDFKLDSVANVLLGRGKFKRTLGTWEMFDHDREMLEQYNREDTQILYELEKRTNVMSQTIDISVFVGSLYGNAEHVSRLLDRFIIEAGIQQNYYYRTEWGGHHEIPTKIPGGYVKTPVTRFHDFIEHFDFTSMYPTLIMTYNISHDTFIDYSRWNWIVKEGIPYISDPAGNRYRTDWEGIIPHMAHSLFLHRVEIKTAMKSMEPKGVEWNNANREQYVVKVIANSLYGIMNQKNCRYYNPNMGTSITLGGQDAIKEGDSFFESKFGWITIYTDTDSLFVNVKGADSGSVEKGLEAYNWHKERRSVDMGSINPMLDLKWEGYWEPFVIMSKKRYFGKFYKKRGGEPELKKVGLETVKRDFPQITKVHLERVISIISQDQMDEAYWVKYLSRLRNSHLEKTYTKEELVIFKSVKGHPKSYDQPTLAARVAAVMITDGRSFYAGMPIGYIVTNGGSPQDGIYYEDYNGSYDKYYYWNTYILAPIARILDSMFSLPPTYKGTGLKRKKYEWTWQKRFLIKDRGSKGQVGLMDFIGGSEDEDNG